MTRILLYLAGCSVIWTVVRGSETGFLRMPAAPTDEMLRQDVIEQIPIPEEHRGADTVTLHFAGRTEKGLEFLIVNGSGKSMRYLGKGITRPLHRFQIQRDGKWVDYKDERFRCGTGVPVPYLVELLAERACVIRVEDLPDGESTVRLGIECAAQVAADAETAPEKFIVWSGPVTLGNQ